VNAAGDSRTVWLLRIIVSVLGVQFLLGIWVNLFGTFPSTDSVATAVMYGGDPVLSAHYVLAVVILLLATILLVSTVRLRTPPRLRWLVLGGWLSVLWALSAGVEFILSGFRNNADSFSMAFAFIVAMTFYGLAQAVTLRPGPEPANREVASPGGIRDGSQAPGRG